MTVFGLQWTTATDAYVRPAESVLTHLAVTSPTNAETLAAVAQASTYNPWLGMRRCNLWDDGTVTAYYGDRCYTDTDVANMGQCMVQIPKFWYTTDHGAGVYKWWISDNGTDALPAGADHAWYVHPAFIRGGTSVEARDGTVKPYMYLGAYEAYKNGTKLESKSGVQPTGLQTIAQFRTAARLRKDATGTTANYWELQDFLTTSAVQLLYLIEYGSFRSQVVLSAGITNMTDDATHNMSSNTGHTSALGNASGQVLHTFDHVPDAGDLTGYAMSYRGIENLYGNMMTTNGGINLKAGRQPWIADHDFNADTFAHPYSDTTLTLPDLTAAAYITDIDLSVGAVDYTFLPKTAGGAAGTHLADMCRTADTNRILYDYGGYWATGTTAGAFRMYLSITSASSLRTQGTRLMYMG